NTLNNLMVHFAGKYTEFPMGSIRLLVDKSDKKEFDTEIFMDIHMDKYPLRDFVSIYSEMSNIVHEYEKFNHRNRKKDDYKLQKHAMHLIRLLIMGTEILNTHEINTYRDKEHELLMDIREGRYEYDKLYKIVEECEIEFRKAALSTTLPEEPDEGKAEELLISIYEDCYMRKR
ncbi:MAG: nucleotidyltransferase domain-containing protein, partial [Bacillota bacterium]|nr:nucleotidyltransferase domain-containing protein [Bacillota bacterium]